MRVHPEQCGCQKCYNKDDIQDHKRFVKTTNVFFVVICIVLCVL